MKLKLLTSSDYFDTPLLETVKRAEVALSLRKGFEKGLRVQIIISDEGYQYEISNSFNKLTSYTAKQLRQWINEGDIVDLREFFVNLHKSAYGFKPNQNIGTAKQWRNIKWLRQMAKEVKFKEETPEDDLFIEVEEVY